MYKIVKVTPKHDAIFYDNGVDIGIQIAYLRGDGRAKLRAIDEFWKHYRRMYENSQIIK
jgi:hypothetical protein